jgi:hypothetical protein
MKAESVKSLLLACSSTQPRSGRKSFFGVPALMESVGDSCFSVISGSSLSSEMIKALRGHAARSSFCHLLLGRCKGEVEVIFDGMSSLEDWFPDRKL